MRKVIIFLATFTIATIDQLTKHYIKFLTDENDVIELGSYLNIVSVWNSGISFGVLSNYYYSNLILTSTTIIIVLILLFLLLRTTNQVHIAGYTLIKGGAIGNLIDRLQFSAVYDFIDLHIGKWHWPAFNLADTMVCCGVVVLVIGELYDKKN